MKTYLIIRRVDTKGKEARIKSKVYITFWNGAGFGCRRLAKEYRTLDDVGSGTCDVASFFYRPSGPSYRVDMEIVEEISPDVYVAPNLSDW